MDEKLEHRARVANARVDKLGKVLCHDVLRGDLPQKVFSGLFLQSLDPNLFMPLSVQAWRITETPTFFASANTDLGEQGPIDGILEESDCVIFCERIGAKPILREYTKNKAARHLPGISFNV